MSGLTQTIFPQFKVLRILNKNRKMYNTCCFQGFDGRLCVFSPC